MGRKFRLLERNINKEAVSGQLSAFSRKENPVMRSMMLISIITGNVSNTTAFFPADS
jgi:hypothetical protein